MTKLLFGIILMGSVCLTAAPPNCHCVDCQCTEENHCGCYSEEGCKCSKEMHTTEEGKQVEKLERTT